MKLFNNANRKILIFFIFTAASTCFLTFLFFSSWAIAQINSITGDTAAAEINSSPAQNTGEIKIPAGEDKKGLIPRPVINPAKPGTPVFPKLSIKPAVTDGAPPSPVKPPGIFKTAPPEVRRAISGANIAPGGAGEIASPNPQSDTVENSAGLKGALSYRLPAGHQGTFETTIDKLYMKQDELPGNILLARVAKMKTNPQICTSKADFDRISKEAFRSCISAANWRIAHTSFYKGKDPDDDTIYICIAVEYKRDVSELSFQKDIELLKTYLKKETSDEYVLLEKFPFIIVMGSNQTGDYEFATVKEIASRLKVKLFGAENVEAAAIVYPETQASGAAGQESIREAATAETQILSIQEKKNDITSETELITPEKNEKTNKTSEGPSKKVRTGHAAENAETPGIANTAKNKPESASKTPEPARPSARIISEDTAGENSKKDSSPAAKTDKENISLDDITADEQ